MKLIKIQRSERKEKKWTAFFKDDDKEKKVHFGASGYDDYTKGATDQQRKSYLARHASGKTAKPDTPNALSYYLLWGSSKSLNENIKSFKKKYNL